MRANSQIAPIASGLNTPAGTVPFLRARVVAPSIAKLIPSPPNSNSRAQGDIESVTAVKRDVEASTRDGGARALDPVPAWPTNCRRRRAPSPPHAAPLTRPPNSLPLHPGAPNVGAKRARGSEHGEKPSRVLRFALR